MSVPANFFDTYVGVAQPTDDTEIVVATLSGIGELLPNLNVHLHGYLALSPGTDGNAVSLLIRENDLAGDIVAGATSTGADGVASIAIVEGVASPGDFAGATYVLTVAVNNASAASTITAVHLGARVC